MVAIVLLPSKTCTETLLEINRIFSDEVSGKIKQDCEASLPHLSLLHAPGVTFNENVQERIEGALESHRLTAELEIPLTKSPVTYVEKGWYFIDVVKDEKLVRLHEAMFQALKGLMLPGNRTRIELPQYSESQWRNYEKYGYRYIGEDYHPHITVTRADSGASGALVDKLEKKVVSLMDKIIFSSMLVCDIGPNGTTGEKHFCKEFIK